MIYGVISDIHGNLAALETALDRLKSCGAQGYICCGDLVGYGPQPNECVEAVAGLENLHCVMGNHDMAALGQLPLAWFNSYAAAAIEVTRSKLSVKSAEFLKKCPNKIAHDDFTLVHGSPRNPAEEYLLTGEQFLENADSWDTQICFIGHSHVSLYFSRRGIRFPEMNFLRDGDLVDIKDSFRYMINPGSVGQPRDRDPRASCGIFDSALRTFECFRLEYPTHVTQKLMRKLNMPKLLIERIGNGW